ncbi:MAG: hypothetical protein HOP08_08600 [Cyclobacteriaceae bacterium]|nr:hypothetical protein [Cyclobacteriaceae bacterium]
MKVKVLKNKSGILSGLVIPVEELNAVKRSLKNDTELFGIIEDLLNTQQVVDLKNETILSSGRTVTETEAEVQKITDKLYADAFSKGIPMFYKDGRSTDLTQFIRANPDGSEDLVNFDATKGEYTLIKNLVSSGAGYWSYLLAK